MLIYSFEDQNGKCYTNQSSLESTARNISLQSLKCVIKTLSSSHFLDLKFNKSEIDLITEDLEAHYITAIKNLIRSLDPNKLSSYYNASQKEFPVVKILLEYSHNPDIMIRNAARISLMWIFQNCHGKAMDYVISIVIPKHLTDIIENLKQYVLDIQSFCEKRDSKSLEKIYSSYKEELEYLDDISNLNICIKKQVAFTLLNYFIEPFIFKEIMTIQNMKYENLKSGLLGLFLLSNLLKSTRNTVIKDYTLNIFLQDESVQKISNTEKKSATEIYKSLQHILQRNNFDVGVLYLLHILNILQVHISENHVKMIQFYTKFTLDLMNIFMKRNHFTDYKLNYMKLKLLTMILQPLTEKVINDSRWFKLKKYFFEALKFLYYDTCRQIQWKVPNLVTVIDIEYDTFINLEVNVTNFFENVNNLNKSDYRSFTALLRPTKVSLCSLFQVRHFYLKFRNKKENILPIIEQEEKIGEIIKVDNCLPCEKLTHSNHYNNKHFLKFTDKQLLIIQAEQIQSYGIIVFNSFYKDISWSIDVNNIMKIDEVCFSDQFEKEFKPVSLYLKFNNVADMQIVIKFLLNARLKQAKIARKKLKELFHL